MDNVAAMPVSDRISSAQYVAKLVAEEAWPSYCIKWPYSFTPVGYPQVWWNGTNARATRLICILAHGEPMALKMHAAHSCGNRWCCNPRHLRWATAIENEADKLIHGKRVRGEKQHASILTELSVKEIRKRLSEGDRGVDLAAQFGVSKVTISKIGLHKSWAWVN